MLIIDCKERLLDHGFYISLTYGLEGGLPEGGPDGFALLQELV